MIDEQTGLAKYGTLAQIKQLLNFSTNADNGLKLDPISNHVQLGGPLIRNTSIPLDVYNLILDMTTTGNFIIEDNGSPLFTAFSNGRIAIGGNENSGLFNVNGVSYFGDDLWLRKGSAVGLRIARIYDDGNDGVIELFGTGLTKVELHANGDSYFTGGNVGIGTDNPAYALEVDGTVGISSLAGVGNRMVTTDGSGMLSSEPIPTPGDLNSLTDVNTTPAIGEALTWDGTSWTASEVSGGGSDITDIVAGAGLAGGGNMGSITLDVNASNGLTTSPDIIEFGGNLTKNTEITAGTFDMIYNLSLIHI